MSDVCKICKGPLVTERGYWLELVTHSTTGKTDVGPTKFCGPRCVAMYCIGFLSALASGSLHRELERLRKMQ